MGLDFKAPCKYTMSANEIRQFSECARKRYYASRDCLAIRANTPNGNLLLGSAFHETLQYYYTELDKRIKELGLVEPSIEDCQDLLDSIPEYSFGENSPQPNEADRSTYNCIVNLYKEQIAYDLVDYEVIGCEQAFYMNNWPIDDVMFHGLIDMVVRKRSNGMIYFFEHKTCAGFRPEIYSRFDIQLHIYAEYGHMQYGEQFGGMILNQVKKAKTERGYDHKRDIYEYDNAEMADFYTWIKAKTELTVSPENNHAPCNNYMSCRTCEYQDICLKYGYRIPKTTKEIVDTFKDEAENPTFIYDPRNTEEVEG